MEASDVPVPAVAAFAVILDVAAPWPDYQLMRSTTRPQAVAGLVLHAAGSTSEGFRTIDVWTSRAAWVRGRSDVEPALEGLILPPVVRELEVDDLVWLARPGR
jgi:hypothetical protein